jgi:hypothetical protein
MLRINPTPKGFVSTADRDIYSDNNGSEITTERRSARGVHAMFQEKGYYQSIMDSDMYAKGENDDAQH